MHRPLCEDSDKIPDDKIPEGRTQGGRAQLDFIAWPGRKQPDIPVEVDTARLETSRTYTVMELPGYFLYRTLHLGVSFLEGGLLAGRE